MRQRDRQRLMRSAMYHGLKYAARTDAEIARYTDLAYKNSLGMPSYLWDAAERLGSMLRNGVDLLDPPENDPNW